MPPMKVRYSVISVSFIASCSIDCISGLIASLRMEIEYPFEPKKQSEMSSYYD
jgi:hypothetical protein